jgi:hypothetical protein
MPEETGDIFADNFPIETAVRLAYMQNTALKLRDYSSHCGITIKLHNNKHRDNIFICSLFNDDF